MGADIAITKLLHDEGFASEAAQAQARILLERHGLTNPRKQSIAIQKLERVQALFAEAFGRVCDSPVCARIARTQLPGRELVIVTAQHCLICGGSSQRRAARVLREALLQAGLRRVVILGGTPPQHATLRELFAASEVELRLIEGSSRGHSASEALPQLEWAQLLVIWASTPLNHKVSVAYTSKAQAGLKQLTIARRGVESLCLGIAEALN